MTRTELRAYMATLRGKVSLEDKLRAADIVEAEFARHIQVLAPLVGLDGQVLRYLAKRLKEEDDEYQYAIGGLVERACELLKTLCMI